MSEAFTVQVLDARGHWHGEQAGEEKESKKFHLDDLASFEASERKEEVESNERKLLDAV